MKPCPSLLITGFALGLAAPASMAGSAPYKPNAKPPAPPTVGRSARWP